MTRRKTDVEEESMAVLQPVTPLQQQFIEQLMSGRSVTESALFVGIGRRTACRWLEDGQPVYIEYEKQRLQHLQEVRNRTASLHSQALAALEDGLAGDAPLAIRLATARFILERNMTPTWIEDAGSLARNEEKSDFDAKQHESSLRLDKMLLDMMA
jgi:hypothetical protein